MGPRRRDGVSSYMSLRAEAHSLKVGADVGTSRVGSTWGYTQGGVFGRASVINAEDQTGADVGKNFIGRGSGGSACELFISLVQRCDTYGPYWFRGYAIGRDLVLFICHSLSVQMSAPPG